MEFGIEYIGLPSTNFDLQSDMYFQTSIGDHQGMRYLKPSQIPSKILKIQSTTRAEKSMFL